MTDVDESKTVLVVDDDPDFLAQQEVQLNARGYEVLTAPGAPEALEALEDRRVDVAVVDLMMGQVDEGFTLCYRLKKQYGTPVILVTGVASETGLEFDATTAEERSWVKADVMLAKPVRFEQLHQEIERLLKD